MLLFDSILAATGSHRPNGIWYAVQEGVADVPPPAHPKLPSGSVTVWNGDGFAPAPAEEPVCGSKIPLGK
jgi:hypothetical protein